MRRLRTSSSGAEDALIELGAAAVIVIARPLWQSLG
jgi:hypothetical protein